MLCAMLVVRRRRQMKYWIHPMTSGRETKLKFELPSKAYPDKFVELYRMSVSHPEHKKHSTNQTGAITCQALGTRRSPSSFRLVGPGLSGKGARK